MDNNYKVELLCRKVINEAIADIVAEDCKPEIVNEGYNLDLRAIMKECKRSFKKASIECKQALQKKDKETAKEKVTEMKNIVETATKNIKSLEAKQTVGSATVSAFVGYFTAVFGDIGYMLKCFLLCMIPIAGWAAALIMSIKKLINEIAVFIDDIKNFKGGSENIVKMFNAYRNNTLSILKRFEDQITSFEKKIDSME